MTDEAIEHHEALVRAFATVLKAEEDERQADLAVKAVKDTYASTQRAAKQAQEKAWAEIERLMGETGEVEVVLPDANHDYKLAYPTTPEVADVPDPDAVPDEFCKLERSPKKKEILDHLKALRDRGEAMPNWATIRRNPSSLTYRLIKKGAL